MEHRVVGVPHGALREAALDAIVEGVFSRFDCITKLLVLRAPAPDRDGRDVERFRQVAVGRAAPAEAAGHVRELGPGGWSKRGLEVDAQFPSYACLAPKRFGWV